MSHLPSCVSTVMYVTCVWPEASGDVSSLSLLSPSLSLQSEVPSSSAVAGRGFSMSDAASSFIDHKSSVSAVVEYFVRLFLASVLNIHSWSIL